MLRPSRSRLTGSFLDGPFPRRVILAAFALTAIAATLACGVARQCNNFFTFRWAFWNLLAGKDLYVLHPEQHDDLFKYSPTFALLFGPFSATPFALALLAWNLLNGLLLYYAVSRLLPERQGTIALALLYVGYALTLDGTQSNGLVAALIVLAFVAFERRHNVGAALAIAVGALIKLFPLAALALAVPHKGRIRFAVTFLAVSATLVSLPLVIASPAELLAQYRSWYVLESVDALDRGASVMSLMHISLGYTGPNWPIQALGTLLLLAPLARRARWDDPAFRLRLLASLLVYSVMFNHKAEQPTFVVALTGIAIWCATSPRGTARDGLVAMSLGLMVPVFLTAIIGQRSAEVATLTLPALRWAAVPCLVSWLMMQAELLGLVPVRLTSAAVLGTSDATAAPAAFGTQ